MTNVWFTADTHFSHAKIAEIRGFESVEDHDDYVIYQWNQTVKPSDTVWHLGDVGMGRIDRFGWQIGQLNGHKHLIVGNHDEVSPIHRNSHKKQPQWLEYFESIQPYARRRVEGRNVLLSHYPYAGDHTEQERYTQYRLPDLGDWLLHGHTHSDRAYDGGQMLHVGVDAWDMRPVGLEAVSAAISTLQWIMFGMSGGTDRRTVHRTRRGPAETGTGVPGR